MSHLLQLCTTHTVLSVPSHEARGDDYPVFGGSAFEAHGRQLRPDSTPHTGGLPESSRELNRPVEPVDPHMNQDTSKAVVQKVVED